MKKILPLLVFPVFFLLVFVFLSFSLPEEKNLLKSSLRAITGIDIIEKPQEETFVNLKDVDFTRHKTPEKETPSKEPLEKPTPQTREVSIKEEEKEEGEEEKESIEKIDINSAIGEDLERLSGIGPVYAQRIIDNRPFCSLAKLKNIPGIGEVTLENIKEQDLAYVDALEECEKLPEKVKEKPNKEYFLALKEAKEEIKEIRERIKAKEDEEDEEEEEEGEEVEEEISEVEINSASFEDLTLLVGIGEAYAQRIIDDRPFCSLAELKNVQGIGEVTLENIKEQGLATVDAPKNCGIREKSTEPDQKAIEEDKFKERLQEKESRLRDIREDLREKRNKLREQERLVKEVKIQRDKCRFSEQININKANKEDLQTLHGIGEAYAKKIKESEKEFKTVEDLQKISGIGSGTTKEIIKEGIACTWEKEEESDDGDSGDEEESFENIIEVISFPQEVSLNQDFEVKMEFYDFEDLDYELKGEIESGDGEVLSERSKEVNLTENTKTETFTFEIAEKAETVGLTVTVEKEEVVIAKKTMENFLEVIVSDEKFTVTFIEENGLEDVEIKIYENADSSTPIGDSLITNGNGTVEKSLEEGSYEFEANLEGYANHEDSFNLEEDKTVKFELEMIENMLENPYFEDWGDDDKKPTYWTGSHSFSTNWIKSSDTSTDGYSIKVRGGGERTLRQRLPEKINTNETYQAKMKIKGTGKVQLGIIYPSGHHNYKNEITLNEDDWRVISHQASTTDTSGDKGGLAIKTTEDGGENPESTLYISRAWLSIQEPPANWPE